MLEQYGGRHRKLVLHGPTNSYVVDELVDDTIITEDGIIIDKETDITQLSKFYLSDDKGNSRRYTAEVPIGVSPEGICFWFHGGYGSGDGDVDGDGQDDGSGGFRRILDFDAAFLQRFIHVYTTATFNDVVGGLCWNAGTPFEFAGAPNDVNYARDVVNECCQRYGINPATQKIVIGGVSAGAMMSIYYSSEAYRQNFTYKPNYCISIQGVIAWDYATKPYSFAGNFTSITSQQDTVVPETGGAFGNYMTLATMQTIIGTIPSSTEFMSTVRGYHSVAGARVGLNNNIPPYTLQGKLEEVLV